VLEPERKAEAEVATAPSHTGAAEVVRWMLYEGRFNPRMREFGDEMCRRIVAAGIPLYRGFCAVETLHPQLYGAAYVWQRDKPGAMRLVAGRGLREKPVFENSPLNEIRKTARPLRRRLERPDCPIDFPALAEIKQEGCTDYLAIPMICSNGLINAITWSTDRPGGFSDEEVAGLTDIAATLSVIVELQSAHRIARSLLNTYVGRRTGERVLAGSIARGSIETISAVIWFCDLRGFTTLADTMARDRLLALLNDYFETMANAVAAEGGEVLKFIGDAMLAIFECGTSADAAEQCAAAVRAARKVHGEIAERNRQRGEAGEPQINFGLALHLGEVSYGNIGAPNRLDFTVIGPAVNHAARLEKLASELGRHLVTSASFKAAAKEPLESLGFHKLRGVREPQEIFAPPVQSAAE
jgi:adenylate cyclase